MYPLLCLLVPMHTDSLCWIEGNLAIFQGKNEYFFYQFNEGRDREKKCVSHWSLCVLANLSMKAHFPSRFNCRARFNKPSSCSSQTMRNYLFHLGVCRKTWPSLPTSPCWEKKYFVCIIWCFQHGTWCWPP